MTFLCCETGTNTVLRIAAFRYFSSLAQRALSPFYTTFNSYQGDSHQNRPKIPLHTQAIVI